MKKERRWPFRHLRSFHMQGITLLIPLPLSGGQNSLTERSLQMDGLKRLSIEIGQGRE